MVDREDAIEWLEENYGDLGEEYWQEAEHQEGQSYWDMFDSIDDLSNDVGIYVMEGGECPECGHHKGYVDDDGKVRCRTCGEVQP